MEKWTRKPLETLGRYGHRILPGLVVVCVTVANMLAQAPCIFELWGHQSEGEMPECLREKC